MFSRLILLLPGYIDYKKFTNFFNDNDYIVAVDGGIEHSTLLNITPNLWIGDFDSCEIDSKDRFSHIPIEEFPTDKDYLDTELALLKAKTLNVTQCAMIGGIGGRLDHQFGLFMILMENSTLNFIHTDGHTELYSLNNCTKKTIPARNFKNLSIIPITEIKNVNITGVKWPLSNTNLHPGKGFSLSNQPIEHTIHYSQEEGLGWLILTH